MFVITILAVSGTSIESSYAELLPELFSVISDDVTIPPSLDARAGYAVDSEMVVADMNALHAETFNVTIFGSTYTYVNSPSVTGPVLSLHFHSVSSGTVGSL